MKKEFIDRINNYLINKIRRESDIPFFNEFPVFKRWINTTERNSESLLLNLSKYWEEKTNNITKNRKNLNEKERREIITTLLLSFPRIPKRLMENDVLILQQNDFKWLNIYHYSCAVDLIKLNGLKPSNFLTNKNDDNEVVWLLDKVFSRKDQIFTRIYNNTIIKKYNSFAYKEIDSHAKKYYIKGCVGQENRIEINLYDFISSWQDSRISKNLYYGFVRYDLGTKFSVYYFLNIILETYYRKMPLARPFLEELISIITTFVKNKYHPLTKYNFSKEKEIRFLYTNMNPEFIPNHFIKLSPKTRYRRI